MEDCMAALLGEDGAPARVCIASSVAESSLTMKKVTHVIDACRACEIHWDPISGLSKPRIVWVSKAQGQQRAGRTGRTNDGTVWRLVPGSMYSAFVPFELASMQLQLLRKESLLLGCSEVICEYMLGCLTTGLAASLNGNRPGNQPRGCQTDSLPRLCTHPRASQ